MNGALNVCATNANNNTVAVNFLNIGAKVKRNVQQAMGKIKKVMSDGRWAMAIGNEQRAMNDMQ